MLWHKIVETIHLNLEADARGLETAPASATDPAAAPEDPTMNRNTRLATTFAPALCAARRGLPLQRQDTRMSPFAMLSTDDYVYTDDPTPPYRSELAWHLRTYYTNNVASARALTGFEYDDHGNRTRVIEHGLCGRTDDDRTTDTAFRTGTDFLVSRPGQIDLYRGAPTPPASLGALAGGCAGSPLALVESTRHEYDGSATAINSASVKTAAATSACAGSSRTTARTRTLVSTATFIAYLPSLAPPPR